MKLKKLFTATFCSMLLFGCSDFDSKLTPDNVEKMVREAYFHTFPIVENYKAMYIHVGDKNLPTYVSTNHFIHSSYLFTPENRVVVSPNNDTFYSTAILDLRAEPMIIKVPEITDRYYSFQLISMTTDNFGYIGTNTTGTKAGTFAITAPDFTGKLPEGVTEIKSPSKLIMVIGRTGVNGDDPSDAQKAATVQNEYQLGGLSKFYPEYKPKIVDSINFPSFVEKDEENEKFFSLLNFLLQYIDLSKDEQNIINKYAKIGVKSGEPYTFFKDNPDYQPMILKGIKLAIDDITKSARNLGEVKNGWTMYPLGEYFGKNYKDRTNIAKMAIYANTPFEAYYPMAFVDGKGAVLNGNNNYSITFKKGELPPVKYFWSLTLYDGKDQFLYENNIKRYSIGDRTKSLKENEDGSLTIYVGNQEPKEGTNNWLPAPKGEFNVILRLYGPEKNVLDGKWAPAPFVKLNQ